jgi:hypothetical protein
MKRRKSSLAVALIIAVTIALSSNVGAQEELTPAVARNLAKEAWLFGLPLVMFEKQVDYSTFVTLSGPQAKAPINQFAHFRKFVDASNRSIVGFNVDNLYSLAWIDLSAEPLVLSVPAMGNRYWIMQIVDAWNGVPAAPGSRTHSGAAPHLFLIAGPDWQGVAPEGMEVLRSPTNLGGVGGRTYCAGDDDYAAVNKLHSMLSSSSATSIACWRPIRLIPTMPRCWRSCARWVSRRASRLQWPAGARRSARP